MPASTLSQLETRSDIPPWQLSCLLTWKEDLNDSFDVKAVLLPVVINVEVVLNIELQSCDISSVFLLNPVRLSRRHRAFFGVEKSLRSTSSKLSYPEVRWAFFSLVKFLIAVTSKSYSLGSISIEEMASSHILEASLNPSIMNRLSNSLSSGVACVRGLIFFRIALFLCSSVFYSKKPSWVGCTGSSSRI